MNRIVITDTAKFEEVITNIENILPSIKDSFESTRKNAQGMSGTNTWKGQSQETLYGKYQQLETNFAPVEETIEMYIRFLKKTLEDYKALENQLDAKVNEYASNQLDVNS